MADSRYRVGKRSKVIESRGRTYQDILQQFVLVQEYHLAVQKTRPIAPGRPESRAQPLYHHRFPLFLVDFVYLPAWLVRLSARRVWVRAHPENTQDVNIHFELTYCAFRKSV